MKFRKNYIKGELINGFSFVADSSTILVGNGKSMRMAIFNCAICKSEFMCSVNNIRTGHTKSCGCISVKQKVGDVINGFKFLANSDPIVFESGKQTRAGIFECVKCKQPFRYALAKIVDGRKKSCGCTDINYSIGNTVNGFKFIAEGGSVLQGKKNVRCGIFKCPECLKEFSEIVQVVSRKKEIHCGCKKVSHGLTNTIMYSKWHGMKDRCSNPKYKSYHCYGGKGIKVCDEWKDNFVAFKEWALLNGYSDNLTIDRKDNAKDYDPSNCRFVSVAEQNRNQTTTKLNWDMVNDIRRLSGSTSNKDLATLFWVSERQIRDVITNKRWKP